MTNSCSYLLFFSPPTSLLSALLFSFCFAPWCCGAAADGRDCLVLLIWQVSLPSCYLSVHLFVCVQQKRSSCLTHAMHTRSLVNLCGTQTFILLIKLKWDAILWRSTCQRNKLPTFFKKNSFCFIVTAFIYHLFVYFLSRCNFHCPAETAITSILTQVIEHKGHELDS